MTTTTSSDLEAPRVPRGCLVVFIFFIGLLLLATAQVSLVSAYSCADSDGGKTLGVKGTVSGWYSNNVYYSSDDFCSVNEPNKVAEGYCVGSDPNSGWYYCPTGSVCKNGACTCTNDCSPFGFPLCLLNERRECIKQSDGCYDIIKTPCTSCVEAGICRDCKDACSSGQNQCADSTYIQSCSVGSGTTCNTWGSKTKCSYGCSNNKCVTCTDSDSDGYYAESACPEAKDCNDNNKNIYPGKTESCNGLDDNCDGSVDEGSTICGDYDKCVSGSCEWKTCEELGYKASCVNLANADCIDNGIYNCDDMRPGLAIQPCFTLGENCGSTKHCEDGDFTSPVCKLNECFLNSAYWNREGLGEGNPINQRDDVTLVVGGNEYCNGKSVSFEIKEFDSLTKNDPVTTNPPSAVFNTDKAVTTWNAEWQDDGIGGGDPEYFFTATFGSSSAGSGQGDESMLHVKQCISHNHTKCGGDGNVHFYDSCGREEEIVDPTCTTGYTSNYCYDDDVYRNNTYAASCEINACRFSVRAEKQAECGVYGCDSSIGSCNSNHCGDGYCDSSKGETSQSCQVDCPENCVYPYGTSSTCSCPAKGCNSGWECDTSKNYGTCVLKKCTIPDGSSKNCDCDGPSDCPSGYFCNLGPDSDACVPNNVPDECGSIDNFQCKDGNVYRCEQVGSRKTLVLSDVCTIDEACTSDVATYKQCKGKASYDLIFESASSGTVVNKQPGDTLVVTVKVSADMTVPFWYDDVRAILDENSNCQKDSFKKGNNLCKLTIKDDAGAGKMIVRAGDDVEVANIITDPYALYITNVPQLYNRFNDQKGVDVLLAKTYEKASQSKGVVYDLNRELTAKHPFSFAFGSYSMPLFADANFNNAYAENAQRFVTSKCNGCKETMVIGDDYVVPTSRELVPLERNWNLLWKVFDKTVNVLLQQALIIGTAPQLDSAHNRITNMSYYSDQGFAQQNDDLNLNELQDVFNGWKNNHPVLKTTLLIVPDNMDANTTAAVESLKAALGYQFSNPIEEVRSSDVGCDLTDHSELIIHNSQFRGKPVVVVGDPSNNNAFRCYSLNPPADSMYVTRSAWDKDEHALIINTNDPDMLAFYAMYIASGQYLTTFAPGMDKWSKVSLGVGTAMIVVGVASSATGIGASWGVPLLMYAGYVLDGSTIVNECYVKNEGGTNARNCKITTVVIIAAPFGGQLIGILVGKYGPVVAKQITGNLNKLDAFANPQAVAKVVKESEDSAVAAKYIADGTEVFAKQGDDALARAIADMPSSMDAAARVRFVKFVGQFLRADERLIQFDDAFTANIKTLDEFNAMKLSSGSQYIKQNYKSLSSMPSEVIASQNLEMAGFKFIKGEAGANAVKYKAGFAQAPVDMLGEFNGQKVAVSVKRAFSSNPNEPYTVEMARGKITEALKEMQAGKLNVEAADMWDRGVLNLIVRDSEEATVRLALAEMPDLYGNQVLITKVKDVPYIFNQ